MWRGFCLGSFFSTAPLSTDHVVSVVVALCVSPRLIRRRRRRRRIDRGGFRFCSAPGPCVLNRIVEEKEGPLCLLFLLLLLLPTD
uniref:Uncharacterized protein n=1 Tax=Caenorhabditis japonica TaxID=281687 RepID=A0A8R1EAX9_CAEJA